MTARGNSSGARSAATVERERPVRRSTGSLEDVRRRQREEFGGFYGGRYDAGRIACVNGLRQGLGVWLMGLLVTVLLAVAGVLLGAEYNVLSQLNLPRIPIDEGALTTGGLIALAAVVVGTLLAAIAGGKAGTHFHRKIDRVGYQGGSTT